MTTYQRESRAFRDAVGRLAQRAVVAVDAFAASEMANHAAAGAYAFLLSAAPASLVIASLATALIGSSGDMFASLLAGVEALVGGDFSRGFGRFMASSGGAGFLAAAFGVVNLVWASRLFVVSIQRGIRVVWAGTANVDIVRENVLTFVAEFAFIVLATGLILAASVAEPVFRSLAANGRLPLPLASLRILAAWLPVAGLFAFIYLTYRFLPPERSTRRSAAIGAALCTLAFFAVAGLFGLFIDLKRYDLLYGVLGRVIAALINVYLFFTLYFFFAEWVFATDNFDVLLLCRCVRLRRRGATRRNRLERSLFFAPERLVSRYRRVFAPGTVLFRKGDGGDSVFFVLSGALGIWISDRAKAAASRVADGEFLGEMARMLGGRRSATAIAETEVELLEIPRALFERFLAVDRQAEKRMTETLSERLRHANERAAEAADLAHGREQAADTGGNASTGTEARGIDAGHSGEEAP